MSKRTEVILACDLCNRTGAQTWYVRTPDGQASKVDVCSKCCQPLRQAFTAGRKTQAGQVQGAEALEVVTDYSPAYLWTAAQEKKT